MNSFEAFVRLATVAPETSKNSGFENLRLRLTASAYWSEKSHRVWSDLAELCPAENLPLTIKRAADTSKRKSSVSACRFSAFKIVVQKHKNKRAKNFRLKIFIVSE
jgi:hypothetical protein